MKMTLIRLYGDVVLNMKAKEVVEIDESVLSLIQTMFDRMAEEDGVGLAANQIGVLKRIFVYDIGYGPKAIINPIITNMSEEIILDEGCLSMPNNYFAANRFNKLHIEGLDIHGNSIGMDSEGFEAQVFQHETDHLNGITLADMLDPTQRAQITSALGHTGV